MPEAFTEFHLTFIADGNIIEKISFQYGESFDLKALPAIPSKDGHDSHWEDFDFNNMTFNKIVEAIYRPLRSVLSSNFVRGKDELPVVLAEGKFSKNVELNVSPFDTKSRELPMKPNKVLEAWKVEIEGLEDEDVNSTLRFLLPKAKKKVVVWQSTNTGWRKLNSSISGSYAVASTSTDSSVFCITENNFSWSGLIISLVVFSIFILLIYFIYKRIQKHQGNEDVFVS